MRQQLKLYCALCVIVPASLACGTSRSPTPTSPTPASGTPYTISGVVTEHHGGPVTGVTVAAIADPQRAYNVTAHTKTDNRGRYSLPVLSASLSLSFYQGGYAAVWKDNLPPQNQTQDVMLVRNVVARVDDAPATGTIWGDEFVSGDDPLGGLCTHAACKEVQLVGSYSERVEIRLRWSNPETQLALYVPNAGMFWHRPASVERYCCSSELIAPFNTSFWTWDTIE